MYAVLRFGGRLGFKTIEVAWFRHHHLPNTIFFRDFQPERTRLLFSLCSVGNDRSTRELAHADSQTDGETGRRGCPDTGPAAAAGEPLPAEYWDSVLKDPRAGANGAQMRQRRLSEIQRHVLRVSKTPISGVWSARFSKGAKPHSVKERDACV
jgi:hypothetical protein